MQAAI